MIENGYDWRAFLYQHGYYAVHFSLAGRQQVSTETLREWMVTDRPKYTGWPPFWWPTRDEIRPQLVNGNTFECLHDGSGRMGHIERWRASTVGVFTIVRAIDSDLNEEPGKYIELILPAWRIGELLLYAGRMAERFESETVDFSVKYSGLSGRVITTKASPGRLLSCNYTTKAEVYENRVTVQTGDIESGVAEVTDRLIRGLFERFQFTLPAELCEQEITRMRSNRF